MTAAGSEGVLGTPPPHSGRYSRPGEAPVRRRPSGEPPPLPRRVSSPLRGLLGLGLVVVILWSAMATTTGMRLITGADATVLRAIARLRSASLTDAMDTAAGIGSIWTLRAVAWTTLVVLAAARRFPHLLAALVVLLAVPVVGASVSGALARMRPTGVEILGSWSGFAQPSMPVAYLALGSTVALWTLAPPGRWRTGGAWVAGAVVGLVVAARLYLAVDHPTDAAAALVLGAGLPTVAFRLLTPEEVFPVTYRRGRRAHLDVGGRRGEAVRAALATQLGVEVVAVEPFALSGSAGSTPLRLTTTGAGGPAELFGKLYAATHLWSDRWYKLGRTVRYGRLEDERPFSTVRRLVEYEDHMLRVMADAGLPVPRPYGVVEITPEREYVVVTEFVDGATRLAGLAVTEEVIDDALATVRRLWSAGLAHRDIKPANVLIRDQRIVLIDLAFAEVRPTPWRQAVDLANMMLTLALAATPKEVYRRALLFFSPEEIAEAFAASRSVTVPAQLRAALREDGRELPARFRALAPPRPPVAIQRWSVRRLGLTAGVVAGAALALALATANLRLAGLL